MNRDQIAQLASIMQSPLDRPHSKGPRMRCPYSADYERHPPSRGTPTFTVKVSPGEPSVSHCFRCKAGGLTLRVFAQALAFFRSRNQTVANLEEAHGFVKEVDVGGFYGALAAARQTNIRKQQPIEETKDLTYLESYAMQCHNTGVHPSLIERGITQADIDRWQIGHDLRTHRSTFPIYDFNWNFVGVSRRTCVGDRAKYHDLPTGTWKQNIFLGEHLVDTTINELYLTEGVTSTIFASKVLPNVLGLLGASVQITPERLAKLSSWASNITLLLDGDKAGEIATFGYTKENGVFVPGLYQTLKKYFYVKVAKFPDGEDPASVDSSNLTKIVANSFCPTFDTRRRSAYHSRRRKNAFHKRPKNRVRTRSPWTC